MLRYSLHDGSSAFRFKLSGDLAGADVVELEQCWRTALSTIGSRDFVIDMNDLTGLDAAGRALLELWGHSGAQFLAKSERSRLLVESITGHALPAARKTTPLLSSDKSHLCYGRLAAPAAVIGLGLLLPATVWAEAESVAPPDVVLSRYTLAAERNNIRLDGEAVVIDIEAELPKLVKKGRRLSADAHVKSLPISSTAVSAANYKFRFIGAIGNEPALTYVYRITPKKKRVGLIQGELWIDAASGVEVRRAGRFVKQPSVFLRRVDIVQDTDIREGSPYLHITRLTIDTRLTGRVELTIREHPGRCADIPSSAAMSSGASLALTCAGFVSGDSALTRDWNRACVYVSERRRNKGPFFQEKGE